MAPRQGPGVLPFASEGGDEEDRNVDVQFGREVTLPRPSYVDPSTAWGDDSIGSPVDVVWCNWREPRQATVLLRLSGGLIAKTVWATLTTSIGAAKFSRSFPVLPGPHTVIRVFGSSIHVAAFAVGDPTIPVAQRIVGALSEGDTNPLGEIVPVWTGDPGTGPYMTGLGAGPNPITRPGLPCNGFLLGLSGFLDPAGGVAGTPYYLQVFDVAIDKGGVPVWWTTIVSTPPLLILGPVLGGTAANFSFDRSLRPSLRFSKGLGYALSLTAATYTPAVGVGLLVQADYGI